jgi:hypothetical protein
VRTANLIAWLLIALTALSACKKDKEPSVSVGTPDGGSADASSMDGSMSDDGAVPTGDSGASTRDSGRDASVDEDTGSNPGLNDPSRACDVASENSLLDLSVPVGTDSAFTIAAGLTGFGVVYRAPAGCGMIGALPVASLGPFAEPMLLFGDECKALQDVALVHANDGWRLAWVDNAAGSAELQTLGLSSTLGVPMAAARTQITKNALREYRPVLAEIASVPHIVWIAEDPSTGMRQIAHKKLDGQSEITSVLGPDANHKPLALAFAQMGAENSAVAFTEEQAARGVWLARLDKAGALIDEPLLVSDAVSAGNSVDLATRDQEGGGVIYSVDIGNTSHEVRFRRLDKTGAFLGGEVKVIGGALQGRDASLARVAGGYVVAYRTLPSETTTKSEVRLTFITKDGSDMRDGFGHLLTFPVADAGPSGGRVTVRISTEGELLVGFLDSDAAGAPILRLVRKRLDCML